MKKEFEAPNRFLSEVNETYAEHLPRIRYSFHRAVEVLGMYLDEPVTHRDEESLKDLLVLLASTLFNLGEVDRLLEITMDGFAPEVADHLRENRESRSGDENLVERSSSQKAQHIRTADAQNGDSGRTPAQNRRHPETAEKQPFPPPESTESAETGSAIKMHLQHLADGRVKFEGTPDELIDVVNEVNKVAHKANCSINEMKSKSFREKEDLKRSLIGSDEILVCLSLLEESYESVKDIVELLPDIETDTDLNEHAARAYSRLRCCLRLGWRKPEPEDIDLSDNDGAESAQVAKNGHDRVQHRAAVGGAA